MCQFNQKYLMNITKALVISAILAIGGVNMTNAQGLSDLFKGDGGQTIGNILSGVFSSSDITLDDLQGKWVSSGPAVCFQGEGFLKKAGGIAAAATIESKLAPYYSKYGLTNAIVTIDDEANFTIELKALKLKGTVTQPKDADPGVFEFSFTALGAIPLGSVTTYVQKTSQSMDLMFDATKMMKVLTAVAKFTGIKLASALSDILDSYDGLCVGFRLSADGGQKENAAGGILDGLGNIFGGGAKGTSTTGSSNKNSNKNTTTKGSSNKNTSTKSSTNGNTQNGDNLSNGLDRLRQALEGRRKK